MCGVFFSPDREFIIDKAAFAVNERCYDLDYTDTDKRKNGISQGLCHFNENRVVGKALYGIILDNNPYDENVISGFNTR